MFQSLLGIQGNWKQRESERQYIFLSPFQSLLGIQGNWKEKKSDRKPGSNRCFNPC